MAEEQQPQRDIYRPADAGSDLRERHQAHAVAGGQDRHIAGAALPALSTGNNRHIDRVHPYLFTNQETGRHQRGDGTDDHQQVG